ncbi:MAG TPA: hypothetical protein VL614_15280 [Acetobacteraceae bacterium]|jgi:hypothetical protein|nr:hypothetical protein [Acetobacteraceae bacterium]
MQIDAQGTSPMAEPQSEYRGPHYAFEGFYRVKLNRKGVWVAAEIRFVEGKATAFIDGELSVGGTDSWQLDAVDRIAIWGEKITPSEHNYLLAVAKHAREHQPDHPAANPKKPINLRLLSPLYQRRSAR